MQRRADRVAAAGGSRVIAKANPFKIPLGGTPRATPVRCTLSELYYIQYSVFSAHPDERERITATGNRAIIIIKLLFTTNSLLTPYSLFTTSTRIYP